jgi:Insect cuticle protein
MASKFLALFACVAFAAAAVIPEYEHEHDHQQHYAAPVVTKAVVAAPVYKHVEYPDAPAQYEFAYDVHDDHTGDVKSQKETRHGDDVQGQYSLIDADGHRRTVTYTADEEHGFQATVHREPLDHKVVAAAPVVKYAAEPAYNVAAAPVVKYAAEPAYKVAAPVVKYASEPVYKVAAAPVVKYAAAPVAIAAAPAYKVASAPVYNLAAPSSYNHEPQHGHHQETYNSRY